MRRVPGGIHLRGQRRHARAGGVYLHQWTAIVRGVNDHIVLAPCATAGILRVRQRGHRTAACGNPVEFARTEETYEPAVRRPERTVPPLGSSQLLDRAIEVADPQHVLLFRGMRGENQPGSIWR